MQNTNGIDGDTDINLSGESSAYFDNLECGNFQNTPGSYFTGVTSNIQNQINGISVGLAGYVTLGTTQTITGQKIFNSIPTTSLTPSISTEFIPRGYADGRYGRLASTNTWSLINTFSNGIIPRRSAGDGTDLQISNNAMANRQTASTNNIGIGLLSLTGDTNPAGYIYNTGSKNIAIGNSALQKMDGGSSCIAIGYQSMQNVSQQRIYGAGVFPSRCIAIGETTLRSNLYGNDQIAIGHNALTNVTSGNSNICIGTNAGNGLTSQGEGVFIGAGCAPTVSDNSITCVGAQALGGAVGQFNSGVAIGYQSFYNNNNASANTGVGAMSGLINTTGEGNTCLGCFAGRFNLAPTLNSTTTIGYASSAEADREFVVGGNGVQGDTQYLTLPLKHRINCCQFIGAVATYTIDWRSNEYVIVNTVTTSLINLPQAIYANSDHVGACFHIVRTHLSYTDLVIAAYGLEKINFNGSLTSTVTINNWVGSISFVCVDNVNGNGVWAVYGYQPRALLATDANKIQTLTDSTNVNYPMCFTTISNGINYFGVLANSNLTYNPSTGTITSQNINVSGTFISTGTFRITNYRPYEVGAIVNNAVALPGAPSTLFGSYTFQSGVADAVIILPIITIEMIGCAMGIRRIVNSSFQLIIKTAAGSGATIVNRDSTATTATNVNYVLLNTLQYMTTIMPISTTEWVVISVDVSETVTLFGSNPNPTVAQSIPFSGTTSGNHQLYIDNADLNYTESTATLKATNVVVTGTLSATVSSATNSTNSAITNQTGVATTFYPTFVNGTSGNRGINVDTDLQYRPDTETLSLSNGTFQGYKSQATAFQYLTQNALIMTATTLTDPLRSYYPFTMKTAAGYTITLPEVTATNVGTMLTFKRIGGNLQALTIAMSANQASFLLGNNTGQTANYILCSTVQSCGTMVAIQTQDAGDGTFNSTAGSPTITINIQAAGTLFIGGKINLNGVDRVITAYGTGRGGTGTYTVNSNMPTTWTSQIYISSVSYAWGVTSVQ